MSTLKLKSFGKMAMNVFALAVCLCMAAPSASAQLNLNKLKDAAKDKAKEKVDEKTNAVTGNTPAATDVGTSTSTSTSTSTETTTFSSSSNEPAKREVRKSFSKETETPSQPWEIATEQSLTTGHGDVGYGNRRVKGSVTATLVDGVLTIKGPGMMADFNDINPRPWGVVRNEIKSVVIGDDVHNIGRGAFVGCENLTSVKIGKTLLKIGGGAFANCTSLTGLTIPKSVSTIEDGPGPDCRTFDSCISLAAINVEAGSERFLSEDGVLYKKGGRTNQLVCYPAGKKGASFKIPANVDLLLEGAFSFNTELTEVTFSPLLASMGNLTFENCTNLRSIILLNPERQVSIQDQSSWQSPLIGVDLSKLKVTVSAAFLEKYTLQERSGWYGYNKEITFEAGNF